MTHKSKANINSEPQDWKSFVWKLAAAAEDAPTVTNESHSIAPCTPQESEIADPQKQERGPIGSI